MMSRVRGSFGVAAAAAAGIVLLHRLATPAPAHETEVRRALPGDQLVTHPIGQTTHAISIDAPPRDVWPWLAQLGYHRGGWYTPQWIDRVFFHMENPGAERV